MANQLDNLGDYNLVRIDLQNANGSIEKLYKDIGDTAVAKATPRILLTGGAIVMGIYGLIKVGQKGIQFKKDRTEKIKNESILKAEFVKVVEDEIEKADGEEVKENLLLD